MIFGKRVKGIEVVDIEREEGFYEKTTRSEREHYLRGNRGGRVVFLEEEENWEDKVFGFGGVSEAGEFSPVDFLGFDEFTD